MQNSKLLLFLTLFSFLSHIATASPVPPKKNPVDQQIVLDKRYLNYADFTVQGVNVGGWLVLEPYINPSLFEAFRTNDDNDDGIPVDEYHYCEALGQEEATSRLQAHWSSWYTEADFEQMAAVGLNMVRIPIGYWAFQTLDTDPYVTGYQESYFDQAIEWCAKYGLKVWVDLHGAAGSQNGFDNSGLRDSYEFLNQDNLQVTTSVIQYLLKKYSAESYQDVVIGIELINEPLGPVLDMDGLKQYYLDGYDYLRNTLQSDQIVIIHDAFESYHYWDDFLTLSDGNWGVVVDHHHYQVFSNGELERDIDTHVEVACEWGSGVLTESHWTVAGEWAAALTDCAKWVNGVGFGARYDGSYYKSSTDTSSYIGSCDGIDDFSTWDDTKKANSRKYIEAQLDAFELRGGWIIWCWKTETSLEWDLQRLIYNGLFPQPLSDRQYPNQCNFST
ncbi:glycoside hydrolase family 5 protein SCDLUD_000967 [Saccharomycodes ludwigii]|uniref:glycoside hydrolase family 5 protein n=1 Tax=Saccharomycodes ludwigii TaxID=36035 RepID=UPI001E8BA08E|nr:hypothetical protein SCDLUD_000967 [Saccharomycodes ludwigii]KAH3903341.1 hypothetical protein SCDLUD_000967 [Saccharomycodes ludwigii]